MCLPKVDFQGVWGLVVSLFPLASYRWILRVDDAYEESVNKLLGSVRQGKPSAAVTSLTSENMGPSGFSHSSLFITPSFGKIESCSVNTVFSL